MLKLLTALLLAPLTVFAAGDEKDLDFPDLPYPITFTVHAAAKTGAVAYETRYSAPLKMEYDTVLLQGLMPDPALRLEVLARPKSFFHAPARYELDGFSRHPNGRFWARYRAPAPNRQPLRLSVVDLGLKKSGSDLTIYSTELLLRGDLREGEPEVSTAPYVPDAGLSVPQSAPFSLVRRAEWQARPPKAPFSPHAPYYFTLHHTQGHYPTTFEASLAEVRFIQDYHQNAKKWNDIGYHFLIDPQGIIFEGRPIGVIGAHVLNRNSGNVGISILGNYHPPSKDVFSAITQDSFVTVATYVKDTYSIQISSFFAHREIGKTDCPGDSLYAKKNLLRDLIFQPAPQDLPIAPSEAAITPAQAEAVRALYDRLNGR
jgi:hypothetical protein